MEQALAESMNNLVNGFIAVAVAGVAFFILRIATLKVCNPR